MNEALQISTAINSAYKTIKGKTDVHAPFQYWMSLCTAIHKEKYGWPSTAARKQFEGAFTLLNVEGAVRSGIATDARERLAAQLPVKRITEAQQQDRVSSATITQEEKIAGWKRVISIEALDNHAKLVGKQAAYLFLLRCLSESDITLKDLSLPWLDIYVV